MTVDLSLTKTLGGYWADLNGVITKGKFNVPRIKKAYLYAKKAHRGQKRESGDDYLSHPVWVAKVIAQLGVGDEAVMAALLHDCVEDTQVTIEDIADNFGDEVALLVAGLTEVRQKTKGIEVHKTSIETFREFLFSSVDDVRVLIIRLVDKLHNGLTIGSLSKERQIKYAKREFGIYGPIAEYVGLHYFKRILDDIAFKILFPKEARKLENTLQNREDGERRALGKIKATIDRLLQANNISNYEIQSRLKGLYSTYTKIKKLGEKRVKDRVGIRVLTETVQECYTVLGLLHSKFRYLDNEFDDYISSPKPNGYRSIQTTLLWDDGITAEIQIRTKEMHEFNEFGPASHIAYKAGKKSVGQDLGWIRELVKWQKAENEISNYRINVLTDYVYVFTPKGDTIQLPKGSTALDFAYRIHTEIGDHCRGVLINQKMDKIGTVLKTGDMVEVLTGKRKNVTKDWLKIAQGSWAREHIRRATSG